MIKSIKCLVVGVGILLSAISVGSAAEFRGGNGGGGSSLTDSNGSVWILSVTSQGIICTTLIIPASFPSSLSLNLPTSTILNQVFTASATLTNVGLGGMSGRPITFIYNACANTVTTNSSGIASSTFTASGSYGSLPLTASFAGDTTSYLFGDYLLLASSCTGNINIVYIPPPPPVTSLLSPVNNYFSTNTLVAFAWTAVVDTSSAITNYTLQVATSASFTTITYSSTTPLNYASLNCASSQTTYYWRVNDTDSVSQTTIGTSTRCFVVSIPNADYLIPLTYPGLIGRWDFDSTDEDSGTTVYDKTSNHNDMSLQSDCTWVAGLPGVSNSVAVQCSTTSSGGGLYTGNVFSGVANSSWTIYARVKFSDSDAGEKYWEQLGSGGGDYHPLMCWNGGSTGNIYLYGTNNVRLDATIICSAGTYYDMVFEVDNSISQGSLYTNGVLVASGTFTTGSYSNKPFVLGLLYGSYVNPQTTFNKAAIVNGLIDPSLFHTYGMDGSFLK